MSEEQADINLRLQDYITSEFNQDVFVGVLAELLTCMEQLDDDIWNKRTISFFKPFIDMVKSSDYIRFTKAERFNDAISLDLIIKYLNNLEGRIVDPAAAGAVRISLSSIPGMSSGLIPMGVATYESFGFTTMTFLNTLSDQARHAFSANLLNPLKAMRAYNYISQFADLELDEQNKFLGALSRALNIASDVCDRKFCEYHAKVVLCAVDICFQTQNSNNIKNKLPIEGLLALSDNVLAKYIEFHYDETLACCHNESLREISIKMNNRTMFEGQSDQISTIQTEQSSTDGVNTQILY